MTEPFSKPTILLSLDQQYALDQFNNGIWKEQYHTSDTFKNNVNSYKLFDYQTKNKTKVTKK